MLLKRVFATLGVDRRSLFPFEFSRSVWLVVEVGRWGGGEVWETGR